MGFKAAQADFSSSTVIINKQSGEVLINCDVTAIYTLDEAKEKALRDWCADTGIVLEG